jgi:integrase
MSVRKRTWTTSKGVEKEAWIVDYVDQKGNRHLKTFEKKKQADAFATTMRVEVRDGTHTPDSASVSVTEAGKLWIATATQNGLERSTIDQYQQHLDFHIVPHLGNVRLSQLSAPRVRDFEDRLLAGSPTVPGGKPEPRSRAMVKKIRGSLGSILADAQERGLVARNVVRDLRSKRRRGGERRAERRQKGRLKMGVDIPTRDEIRAIVEHAGGRSRPLLLTAIFTGLRASELRGLRWSDIDFDKGELRVHQRADRYGEIGEPKSEAGERTVPLPPILVSALREWKLACPKGKLGLVFPNGAGNVESHANIVNRALVPVQIAAGVVDIAKDGEGKVVVGADGEPVRKARYTGLHVLRHWFASWCINRKADGGLELPGKVVQERLGHSSITMTMDVYGHLFPRGDTADELAEAERHLLG